MKSTDVLDVLLWTTAALCAIAAVIAALRDDLGPAIGMGMVAIVFALIAAGARSRRARSGP